MNTDYVIRITTKHGRTWSYLKEGNGWTQTAPTGPRAQGIEHHVHRATVNRIERFVHFVDKHPSWFNIFRNAE